MWKYTGSSELYHGGKPGMKWGYNDGQRNGGRVADEVQKLKDAKATEYGNHQIALNKEKKRLQNEALRTRTEQARWDKQSDKEKQTQEYSDFKNTPPEDYNPKLHKITINGVPGYANDRGDFFSSRSKVPINVQSWQADVAESEKKAKIAASKAPSDIDNAISSGKKKIEKFLNNVFK